MGRHVARWVIALPCLLVACGGPAAEPAVTSGDSVRTTLDSAGVDADRGPPGGSTGAGLALEGEGLRVFLEPSGSARPIPFGAPRDWTMRTLTRVLDQAPVEEGENPDCAVRYARWGNELVVVFARGEFAGWSVGRGSTLTTAAGVGLGSTRAELESAYAAQVAPSTLGIEFSAGGFAGALESASADAPIIALWAGVACLGR